MSSIERVVLVTGACRYLGARIVARLSADASIGRIICVDTVAPRPGTSPLGRAEFVRADIRNPLIAKVLDQAHVDTVVHPGLSRSRGQWPGDMPESEHTAGTVQLLASCERSMTVGRVIAGSTTGVYGSSRRDPAVFSEDMDAASDLPPGYARTAVEVESKLRSFARRRPDITLSVLRLADLIGPTVDSWLTRYLTPPIVATSLGFGPRLQLLHEADAVEVFHRTTAASHPGVTNVAADGVVTLAQLLRWAGRLRVPLPAAAVPSEDVGFLKYGRVVDTTRLKTRLGYQAQFTTAEAVRSYLDARPSWPRR